MSKTGTLPVAPLIRFSEVRRGLAENSFQRNFNEHRMHQCCLLLTVLMGRNENHGCDSRNSCRISLGQSFVSWLDLVDRFQYSLYVA